MKKIILLAAVDREWGIGYQNKLLFHIKQDMDDFRNKTIHNIVVMGRKTFESLPGGKPLPDRKNIVLSRTKERDGTYGEEGAEWVGLGSVQEVLDYVEHMEESVFIIGGGEIYRQFLPVAAEAYITKVNAVKSADTFFPNLDHLSEWDIVFSSNKQKDDNGIEYQFVHYRKRER